MYQTKGFRSKRQNAPYNFGTINIFGTTYTGTDSSRLYHRRNPVTTMVNLKRFAHNLRNEMVYCIPIPTNSKAHEFSNLFLIYACSQVRFGTIRLCGKQA
jgi:hypothetical protein